MSGARAVSAWDDATMAAALFAVDPLGVGGVSLRAMPGPVRERWLDLARRLLPAGIPWRRLPLHIGDDRLLGGLDLAGTLRSGRPVVLRGALAEADGGVVQLAMAERLTGAAAARLAAVLDTGEVALERDGLTLRHSARLALVALDEGLTEDERPPPPLLDRLAFHLDLATVSPREAGEVACSPKAVTGARTLLPVVHASDEVVAALCAVTLAFGIRSARAPLLALRAARAATALAGRSVVGASDAALAARLVLTPRAEILPAQDRQELEPERDPPHGNRSEESSADAGQPLGDVVLAAAQAAIPADLLMRLRIADGTPTRGSPPGRGGDLRPTKLRGRPVGVRPGSPRSGLRLSVVETLRAAAPWQPIRRRNPPGGASRSRIEIRADDFRVIRLKQRTRTTTIFVVDASGSSAFQRLAEAKGAVELLLAECYVRRDQVALMAFRGSGAELLLSPTRSLARAKRSLAALPGGGGTPLAAGIDAALALADEARRRGDTPAVVLLTDGQANIARDGRAGRARAAADALAAARRMRTAGHAALLVDTSPYARPGTHELAEAMGARYLPLPHADAAALSRGVRAGLGGS